MALSKFGKAFAAARKAGKKEFSFGGKSYNTKVKGEGGSKKGKTPVPSPKPVQAQGKASASMGTGGSAKASVSSVRRSTGAKSGASRSTVGKTEKKVVAGGYIKADTGPYMRHPAEVVASKAKEISKRGAQAYAEGLLKQVRSKKKK